MGTQQRRLEKLEQIAGNPGFCRCGTGPTVIWEDEPPPPETCPDCGRPIQTITITWADDPPELEATEHEHDTEIDG